MIVMQYFTGERINITLINMGLNLFSGHNKVKNHLNIAANQKKRIISSNRRFVIMCLKEQHKSQHDFVQVMSLNIKIV